MLSCTVVQEPGTQTSYRLQPMFDAWAESAGVRLYPGTVYLCAQDPILWPQEYIGLHSFEGLHDVDGRRHQPGYAPRLYPVSLAETLLAWVYRWSDDDPRLGFVGNLGDCRAEQLIEVVAPLNVKASLGLSALTLRFLSSA